MPPKKKSKAALKKVADDEGAKEENETKDEVEDVTMPPKKKSKAALKKVADDEGAKEENETKDEVEDVTMPPKKKSKATLKKAADDEVAKEENETKDEVEDVTMPPKKKSKATLKAADDERAKEENETKDEVEDDDGEEEDDDDEVNAEEHGRGKRKRRESKNYEPDDFTMASYNAATKASTVLQGRGEKLGEIATVKASMNKYKLNSDEFPFAYKFVFSSRGIANKKLMKEKLLDFSGYLPPLPKGKYNKERQEEEDEAVEVSILLYFGKKLFELCRRINPLTAIWFNVGSIKILTYKDKICNKSLQDECQSNQDALHLFFR